MNFLPWIISGVVFQRVHPDVLTVISWETPRRVEREAARRGTRRQPMGFVTVSIIASHTQPQADCLCLSVNTESVGMVLVSIRM